MQYVVFEKGMCHNV